MYPETNQRSRHDITRRLAAGDRANEIATRPPSVAPAVLEMRSITFASRGGTNICNVSSTKESAAPAATATEIRPSGGRLRGTSATKQPNGAYATMFAITSKRVHRGGQGAKRKKGVPGAGAIHGENGCRLA